MTLLNNKYIVAIDDSEAILTFLRISLEASGARFDGAATASGGMAFCETEQPDLVILDLGLPDHQGLTILPRLKRLYKKKKLAVIVLTARQEQESRDKAKELGADAYLTKPFVINDLIAIIKENLSASHNEKLEAAN